jgi:hypothetical protein
MDWPIAVTKNQPFKTIPDPTPSQLRRNRRAIRKVARIGTPALFVTAVIGYAIGAEPVFVPALVGVLVLTTVDRLVSLISR